MNAFPTQLERAENGLRIHWSDGEKRQYRLRELRDACPCATCREKRSQPKPALPILTDAELEPLQIKGMKPVGNYAYSIAWSDGHDTGIYSFELLKTLGQQVE